MYFCPFKGKKRIITVQWLHGLIVRRKEMYGSNKRGSYGWHPSSGYSQSYASNPGRWGTRVMGIPANPNAHPANQQAATWVAGEAMTSTAQMPGSYATQQYVPPAVAGTVTYHQSNPYVTTSPPLASSGKSPMDTVLNVLNRWGKKLEETTKKAEDYAGSVWQHLKTGPSFTDTAMGRIAQGTRVLTEGGCENIFRQTFETLPGEKLRKSYACYLSTSAGPIIGTLYLSTLKLAFCSDSPLAYTPYPGQTEWSYYKVVVLLSQLQAVNPSANRLNPAEKYIQIITADNHEFWFMGFFNYDKALKSLQEILRHEGQ